MKKENKLKIRYSGFDEKTDKAIERFAKKLGFKWEGSGYDFRTKERDLAFYK